MSESQQQIHEEVLDDLKAQRESGVVGNPAGGLMLMRQCANHPLLTRRQYTDDKLYEIAKTLCRRVIFRFDFIQQCLGAILRKEKL